MKNFWMPLLSNFFSCFTQILILPIFITTMAMSFWPSAASMKQSENISTLRLEPEMANAHGNIGICLALKKNLDRANSQFRQALELDPNTTNTHAFLGAALAQKGDQKAAMDQFQKAIEQNPADFNAHISLAYALTRQKTPLTRLTSSSWLCNCSQIPLARKIISPGYTQQPTTTNSEIPPKPLFSPVVPLNHLRKPILPFSTRLLRLS